MLFHSVTPAKSLIIQFIFIYLEQYYTTLKQECHENIIQISMPNIIFACFYSLLYLVQ